MFNYHFYFFIQISWGRMNKIEKKFEFQTLSVIIGIKHNLWSEIQISSLLNDYSVINGN